MVRVETPKRRETVWTKGTPKEGILKELPQKGKRFSVPRDAGRKAKLPGKRVSKTGNVYWETRKNRSDLLRSNL